MPNYGIASRLQISDVVINVQDQLVVASGQLGWFGQTDQLVFTSTGTEVLSVVTFDANLNMTSHATGLPAPSSDKVYPFGLAVGRFDPPDVNGTLNPNLQIALLAVRRNIMTGAFETRLEIFTVDPSNDKFTPQLASTHVIANGTLFPGFIDPSTGN